jgi:hypothetical protein
MVASLLLENARFVKSLLHLLDEVFRADPEVIVEIEIPAGTRPAVQCPATGSLPGIRS